MSSEAAQLAEAEAALARGDHATCRRLARALAGAGDAPTREAGRRLLRATGADPVITALTAALALLLALIWLRAY